MRRQAQQVQPVRNLQLSTRMPASLIQHQEHVLVWPHPLFLGEGRQSEGKGRGSDRWQEEPAGPSGPGLHQSVEIHPLLALADHGPHSGSLASPDAAQDRFEADAVFILAPEFQTRCWRRLAQCLHLLGQFF
jgi:hypothetical protein